ncbi:MAG: N-methyl-L-tryptophan oxidase [Candidatus Limnocylindrales bacterium]
MSDVVVVGLGADGSAAAMHLARRGERVLGLEAFPRGHTLGSSGGRTRVIRVAYYEHPDYVPLLRRAWELWRGLETATGEELLRQTGGLYAGPPDGPLITGSVRSAAEHHLDYEILGPAELRARMPLFRFDPEWSGVFETTAGFLFPERAIAAHQSEAERHGATLRFDSPVTAVRQEPGGVAIELAGETVRADRVVVTAGAWNGRLLPTLAPLLQVRRVPLFWFEPPAAEREALSKLPVYIVDSGTAHGYYGFPYLADQGLKVATHGAGTPCDPDTVDRETTAADAAPVERFLADRLPAGLGALRSTKVCMYTVTPDEHFVIDADDRVIYASACSGHGFKFASVIGEVLADLATIGRTPHQIGFLSGRRFA